VDIDDIIDAIRANRVRITDHVDEEAEKKMKPFEKCPICGGELEQKKVEKLLRGGKHTAVLRINAEVCTHCGERLYAQDSVRYFEQIRNKLRRQELSEFQPLGQSFEVTGNFPNKSSLQA
jgi:YgiT-type zinc finger domain-containing protein